MNYAVDTIWRATISRMRVAVRASLIVYLVCLFNVTRISLSQATLTGGTTVTGGVTVTGGSSVPGGPLHTATWSDAVRRATLSVGQIQQDSNGARFTTGGAAIVVRDSRNRCFIATARHVFVDPNKNWAPESLRIRGWRDEGKDRSVDLGSTLMLRRNHTPLYLASESFDLAIVPLTQEIENRLFDENRQLFLFDPTTIGGDAETYDGADVFILGFPGLVGEQYQQRALMRAGIIAWTDTSGPSGHEFLVDARIFPGNSGGPVLSSAAGMNRDASISTGKPTKLLGIVSMTINAKPELALGMELPDDAKVIGAAGVGVIEPAAELLNLMTRFP